MATMALGSVQAIRRAGPASLLARCISLRPQRPSRSLNSEKLRLWLPNANSERSSKLLRSCTSWDRARVAHLCRKIYNKTDVDYSYGSDAVRRINRLRCADDEGRSRRKRACAVREPHQRVAMRLRITYCRSASIFTKLYLALNWMRGTFAFCPFCSIFQP